MRAGHWDDRLENTAAPDRRKRVKARARGADTPPESLSGQPPLPVAPSLPAPASTGTITRRTAPRLVDHLDSPFWVLVSGLLLGLSFPPLPTFPLALVALVPLLVRWSRTSNGWMLLREAYSVFLLMTAVAGHWVLFHQDTLTALFSGLGLLLLPLPMSLAVAASSHIRRRFGMVVGFVALVSFALAAEYFVTHGPVRLPWLL